MTGYVRGAPSAISIAVIPSDHKSLCNDRDTVHEYSCEWFKKKHSRQTDRRTSIQRTGGRRRTLKSYVASGFSSQAMTSGAIQYGVPMKVFLLPTVLSNWAETPKSTVGQNTHTHTNKQNIVFHCVLVSACVRVLIWKRTSGLY